MQQSKTKQPETFKGHVVHRDATGIYVLEEKVCACGEVIKGRRTVSVGGDGKFTTLQTFRPDIKGAGPIRPGSKEWQCASCKTGKKKVKGTLSMGKKVVEKVKGKHIQGRGKVYFIQDAEGTYWYSGDTKVIVNAAGRFEVHKEGACCKCGSTIKYRASVSGKDGVPFNVAPYIPVGQKAETLRPGAQSWVCESCLTGKAPVPAPAPEEEPLSEEEILQDVIQEAAQAAGLDPVPKDSPLSPPLPSPQGIPKVHRAALEKLESMALDSSIDDRMFRGAAWMLARTLGGELL